LRINGESVFENTNETDLPALEEGLRFFASDSFYTSANGNLSNMEIDDFSR